MGLMEEGIASFTFHIQFYGLLVVGKLQAQPDFV